jgi:heat shock protein HtpX
MRSWPKPSAPNRTNPRTSGSTLDTREEAPTLFAVVDRVASAVGTRAPRVIAVGSNYNAAVSAYGLRRRRVLYLGLAMWGVLTPQQLVALLGHELGHS